MKSTTDLLPADMRTLAQICDIVRIQYKDNI